MPKILEGEQIWASVEYGGCKGIGKQQFVKIEDYNELKESIDDKISEAISNHIQEMDTLE